MTSIVCLKKLLPVIPVFRRFLRVVCGEEGVWLGPRCVPDECAPLPDMYSGAYMCTDKFNLGSTCTMRCPENPEVSTLI